MSDRPTPETDAVTFYVGKGDSLTAVVHAVKAKKFERERDELRNYLDTAHYATCNRELRAENARLREQLNDAQTNVKALTATVDNVRAENERLSVILRGVDADLLRLSELRAEVERLRDALERLRDCDWVIGLPDRMDAVRAIAREALAGKEGA
jgi:predicted RNase H-like nuclease (RuvC/YqgF family)